MSSRSTRTRTTARRTAVAGGLALTLGVLGGTDVLASVIVGSPGNDVSSGTDTDNEDNTFIQPAGVAAQQHLDNTDVVFGRDGDDLISGLTGSDVLIGGNGNDILVGGPDSSDRPGSDTLLGDDGSDVAVWSTGDRSETFVGDVAYDSQVVGRLLLDGSGDLQLSTYAGRQVPQVSLSSWSQSCTLTRVPPSQGVGEEFLVRVRTDGYLTATLRMRLVERVVCSSSRAGYARVADLTAPTPYFRDVPLADLGGLVGAIVTDS